VWDTLLETPRDELEVVVAHELGHRRMRHMLKGTILAMTGAVAFVAVLRLVLPHPAPHDAALVLLVATLLELAALPFASALSRRWERAADRFSVALTGDAPAFRRVHRRLALANLGDLAPPRLAYFLLYSHPTAPERLDTVHESG
jgi:STE24 endopeptidase